MATLAPPRFTRAHLRTMRAATDVAVAGMAVVFARLIAEERGRLLAATLPARKLARSQAMRDGARAFVVARLRLHGFRPVGHSCWSRDGGLPTGEARALEECDADVDAALRARGLGDLLPRYQGEQRDQQAGEAERGASEVHALNVSRLVRAGECDE